MLTGFYQKVLTKKGPLQRRFISTQLHRGIAGSSVLVNYAVRGSTEPYKKAFKSAKISELSSMHAKIDADELDILELFAQRESITTTEVTDFIKSTKIEMTQKNVYYKILNLKLSSGFRGLQCIHK